MKRELKFRKTGEFLSTYEAQTTASVIRVSGVDFP